MWRPTGWSSFHALTCPKSTRHQAYTRSAVLMVVLEYGVWQARRLLFAMEHPPNYCNTSRTWRYRQQQQQTYCHCAQQLCVVCPVLCVHVLLSYCFCCDALSSSSTYSYSTYVSRSAAQPLLYPVASCWLSEMNTKVHVQAQISKTYLLHEEQREFPRDNTLPTECPYEARGRTALLLAIPPLSTSKQRRSRRKPCD